MKIKAHVPVQQYGFIEISGTPEEENLILEAYNRYAEQPVNFVVGTTKRLKDMFNNEIDYDEVNHVYSWQGEVYESGSQYANKFRKPFDKEMIAKIMADKIKAKPEDIIKMWELKSQASRDFGNAIHAALQLYEQYNGLATELGKTTHSHDHPVIKSAVDGFMEAHKGEKAPSEVLVVDHKNKRAGQIDRLLILGPTRARVQDFKTNADIQKELEVYWKQLGFYSEILQANGWTTEPEQIFHYDGDWTTYDNKQTPPTN